MTIILDTLALGGLVDFDNELELYGMTPQTVENVKAHRRIRGKKPWFSKQFSNAIKVKALNKFGWRVEHSTQRLRVRRVKNLHRESRVSSSSSSSSSAAALG